MKLNNKLMPFRCMHIAMYMSSCPWAMQGLWLFFFNEQIINIGIQIFWSWVQQSVLLLKVGLSKRIIVDQMKVPYTK